MDPASFFLGLASVPLVDKLFGPTLSLYGDRLKEWAEHRRRKCGVIVNHAIDKLADKSALVVRVR